MKKIIKILIYILLLINISSLIHPYIRAVALDPNSPTPAPTISENEVLSDETDQTTTGTTEEESDQDIDKIRQAVKDKVKEKIDQIINKPDQKLGWVGQISQIEAGQISINCLNQQTRTVIMDEETVIINAKRQPIDTDQLKIDQIVLAMGYIDAGGNLLSKRILITNQPLENLKNTIVLTTVTDVSQTTSIMTLVTKDRQVFQVKTDGTTKDIVKNQKIIAILKQEGNDSNNWQIVDFKVITPLPTPTKTE